MKVEVYTYQKWLQWLLKNWIPSCLLQGRNQSVWIAFAERGIYMYAKQLKASIRPRKWFNMNLGTAVIARMNIILGTLTLGICLDLYYFQYCCTISRNSWDVLRKICNQLFSTLYLVFANIFICFQFPRNHIKDCCPKFATGLKCLNRHRSNNIWVTSLFFSQND